MIFDGYCHDDDLMKMIFSGTRQVVKQPRSLLFYIFHWVFLSPWWGLVLINPATCLFSNPSIASTELLFYIFHWVFLSPWWGPCHGLIYLAICPFSYPAISSTELFVLGVILTAKICLSVIARGQMVYFGKFLKCILPRCTDARGIKTKVKKRLEPGGHQSVCCPVCYICILIILCKVQRLIGIS